MDKAKAAITDFMGRSGHHDTTVHEAVAPAVQHEVVKPHVHEEVNTAIDKEVHQDHYHRTVQPVKDRQVLPETHEAKIGSVQHREFDHRDHDSTKRNLVQEQAQFKDERRIEGTTQSQSVAPVVGGEHIHHHIHETIQPVVQTETIQPNVVHTTVPIHEVHHNKATHHESTALPAMTMDQFKSKGGSLHGREERFDEFEGIPKNIGGGTAGGFGAVRDLEQKATGHHTSEHARHGDFEGAPNHKSGVPSGLGTSGTSGLTGSSTSAGHHDHHHGDRGATGQGNLTGSSTQGGILSSSDRRHDGLSSDRRDDYDTSRSGNVGATGTTGSRVGTDGTIGSTGRDNTTHGSSHDNTTHKPSLMDKLNPKVDANGDGKAGFMK